MSMNQDDVTKYKSLYLQTSWGYLNMLRKNIAFLLSGMQGQSALEAAHLAAHSLKSQSILMGYTQIGEFSMRMEAIFKISKSKILVPNKEVLDIVLSGLNKVQTSLIQISENGQEIDISEEIGKLSAL